MRQIQQINLNLLRRGTTARTGVSKAALADVEVAEGILRVSAAAPVTRDEAAFFLTAAAEIEHALMVQYLYAAYSLNPDAAGAKKTDVEKIRNRLLQIAREEMGHLITVENLLLLIGTPLHLGREHSPYASQIYPFRFKLERLTLDSLAKYVVAESPDKEPEDIPGVSPADQELLKTKIQPAAKRSNDGEAIKHVGPIYQRLGELFAALPDDDFRIDRGALQARWDDWGFEAQPRNTGLEVLVKSFDQTTADEARKAAIAALVEIGDQGEAADLPTSGDVEESHFDRFLRIYIDYAAIAAELGREPTWPVARDPNTSYEAVTSFPIGHMVEAVLAQRSEEGRISDQRTRSWAELFNLRYRLLLGYLLHTFHRSEALYTDDGNRTPRGLLQIWTFGEMRRVKKLAEKLVQMPLRAGAAVPTAGPPFELPYTLQLSDFEEDRWRTHADVLGHAVAITQALLAGSDAGDPFLEALATADEAAREAALAMASTGQLPAGQQPTGYLKTLTILDDAVRGFDISPAHNTGSAAMPAREGAFWRGRSRDDFVALNVNGDRAIVPGQPDASKLLARVSLPAGDPNRMPRHRPRLPDVRIGAIREWIAAGAPDFPPGAMLKGEPSPRPEPSAPVVPPQEPTHPPKDSLTFERDIRPLFREFDRSSMLAFGLDLHDHADVSARASDILVRLEDGTMPCDGAWPPSQIEIFRRWRDEGMTA